MTPSIQELRSRLAAFRASCKRRVQRGESVLSPMDEMMWFESPRILQHQVTLVTNLPTLLLQPNPMRVSLAMSVAGLGYTTFGTATRNVTFMDEVVVGPNPDVSVFPTIGGFCLNVNNTTVTIDCDTFPSLVQGQWWGFPDTNMSVAPSFFLLTTVEIILKAWPQES